jgi:hypothetical protein
VRDDLGLNYPESAAALSAMRSLMLHRNKINGAAT